MFYNFRCTVRICLLGLIHISSFLVLFFLYLLLFLLPKSFLIHLDPQSKPETANSTESYIPS